MTHSQSKFAIPDRRSALVRRSRANWYIAANRGRGITSVVLDIGGVIIPTLFESVTTSDFPKGPLSDVADRYADVEQGEISEREYWEEIRSGWDIDVGLMWNQYSYLRPKMLHAIAHIIKRMPVIALTNDMSYWFGNNWQKRFPELECLDFIFEAAKLGYTKPDPRIYQEVLNYTGVKPEQCLFVDDLYINLKGAEAVGMKTMLFDVRNPDQSISTMMSNLALPWGC